MSEAPNGTDDLKGDQNPGTQPDPTSSNGGESENKNTQARENTNLPENLKGKSPEQIAEMYVNLEKKIGEQSGEVEKARKTQSELEIVLKAIRSNPDLYRMTDEAVRKLQNGEAIPDPRPVTEPKKEEKRDDLRIVTQNKILSGFQEKYGINTLESKEQVKILEKVASELAEILDPEGKKPMGEIYNSIPLDRLEALLDKAYWLANKDAIMSSNKDQNNIFASFGRMPSSGGGPSSGGDSLTKEELEVASRLGVKPEQYKQNKSK